MSANVDRPVTGVEAAIDLVIQIAETDYGLTCDRKSPNSAVLYYPADVDWRQIEGEISRRVSDMLTSPLDSLLSSGDY